MDAIESNPEKYTKYIKEKDEITYCTSNFYDLLLYYRMIYEKVKIKNLFAKKELWEYFADKINFNEIFYPLVSYAEEGFINKIMEQKKLSLI